MWTDLFESGSLALGYESTLGKRTGLLLCQGDYMKTSKSDPLTKSYYKAVHNAELFSQMTFYAAALLSIAILFIDKAASPNLHDLAQMVFVLLVIILFFSRILSSIYWSSRAHEKRFGDLLSHSFRVPLTDEISTGYHSHTDKDPFKAIIISVLENSLFSKSIAGAMLRWERAKAASYLGIWLVCALYRQSELTAIAVAAQIVFSGDVIERYMRLEWLKSQFDHVYDAAFSTIQSTTNFTTAEFRGRSVQLLLTYETSKSKAGISLSSRLFNKLNPSLSQSWDHLTKTLHL